jgi:hypothetical protein
MPIHGSSKTFKRNLVLHSNISGLLFEGNFNASHPQWQYSFEGNMYSSSVIELSNDEPVFGGCSARSCRTDPFQLSWSAWQESGMDVVSGLYL